MSWDYWYVFPYAVFVATICNSSGFSGAVLFQPFFYFVLQTPVPMSIATGIATETIGMSSGAFRYALMRTLDLKFFIKLFPFVIIGVSIGLVIFINLPIAPLKVILGLVMITVSIIQILSLKFKRKTMNKKHWNNFIIAPIATIAGIFSASTGTGVAEITQPLYEHGLKLPTKRANANAILLEASADWSITLLNLSLGNINWNIFIFSASGVLIGGQLGALLSPHISDHFLKLVFSIAISFCGFYYLFTSI